MGPSDTKEKLADTEALEVIRNIYVRRWRRVHLRNSRDWRIRASKHIFCSLEGTATCRAMLQLRDPSRFAGHVHMYDQQKLCAGYNKLLLAKLFRR